MDPSVATSEAPPTPSKDPHLPPLVRIGDLIAPTAPLVQELLEQLSIARLVEALWETGSGGNRYKITDRGREHAARSLEICGYVGPAPVRLEAYSAMLRWQFAHT